MYRTFQAARRAPAAMAVLSLLLAPAAAAAPPPPSKPVGVNAAIRNQVQIRGAGTNQVRPAVLRAQVMLNDEVRTGQASQLQILLLDRSTFTVGANARVAVDRFAFDAANNSRSTGINVARGAFRFMSGRALGHPSGPANVRSPIASIGIRGTIFEGAVGADAIEVANRLPALVAMHLRPDPQTATLVILRGPGAAAQGDVRPGAIDVTAGGRTVTLDHPGSAVFVPRAGSAPIGPFDATPSTLQAMQLLLRTTPEMAAAAAASAEAASRSGGQGQGTARSGGGASGGRGLSGLTLAAIPAVILAAILTLRGSDDGNLPTSP